MEIDIQLQVTDKELEEFSEMYPTNNTTNGPTNQVDTHPPARQFLVLRKETLIQLSDIQKADTCPAECPEYPVSDPTKADTRSAQGSSATDPSTSAQPISPC